MELVVDNSSSDVFSELCWKDERAYSRIVLGRGVQLEQENSRSHVEAVIIIIIISNIIG